MPRYIVQRTFPGGTPHPSSQAVGQSPVAGDRAQHRGRRHLGALLRQPRTRARRSASTTRPTPKAIRKTAPRNELPVDQITQVRVPTRTSTPKERRMRTKKLLAIGAVAVGVLTIPAAAIVGAANHTAAAQPTDLGPIVTPVSACATHLRWVKPRGPAGGHYAGTCGHQLRWVPARGLEGGHYAWSSSSCVRWVKPRGAEGGHFARTRTPATLGVRARPRRRPLRLFRRRVGDPELVEAAPLRRALRGSERTVLQIGGDDARVMGSIPVARPWSRDERQPELPRSATMVLAVRRQAPRTRIRLAAAAH